MKIKQLTIVIILMLIISSCASKKDVLLFQDLNKKSQNIIQQKYASTLQPGDILSIAVSSSDNVGVAPFNTVVTDNNLGDTNINTRQRLANYTIRENGTIEFPVLGEIYLSGKTTLEATEEIKMQIKKYLKEPIILLEWLNFRYTVIGEVNRPGQYQSYNERTSILDALGNAGDISLYANRHNLIVIRENLGVQRYYHVDLTQTDFMNSEAFYIKQNDVIIVQPNNAQIQSSAYNRNTPIFVSIASLLVSVIVLITR